MSYFKHFIFITIFFLSAKAQVYPVLKKYEKVENTNGKVIFESKDFSDGDNMYFKIEKEGECDRELKYGYYNTIEMIGATSTTSYHATYKTSSTTSVNGRVISSTRYFTIKKNSEEYSGSNGNYLLLQIDCYNLINDIDFENTEKDGSTQTRIILVIVLVIFLVVIGVIIGVCCYCIRKRAKMMRNGYINQPHMIMYGAPQPIYPQQGNIPYMYGGQQVMVQPNGIPYNNQNIQYSNIPNNTPSGLAAQNNAVPQKNYNMVPQSSAERGYNSNVISEKVIK